MRFANSKLPGFLQRFIAILPYCKCMNSNLVRFAAFIIQDDFVSDKKQKIFTRSDRPPLGQTTVRTDRRSLALNYI